MSPTRLYFLLRFGKLKTTYLGGVNKKNGSTLKVQEWAEIVYSKLQGWQGRRTCDLVA